MDTAEERRKPAGSSGQKDMVHLVLLAAETKKTAFVSLENIIWKEVGGPDNQ